MANSLKKFDKNKLNADLPNKKPVIKKENLVVDMDKSVQSIHPAVKEPSTRVTLDLPDSLYKSIKKKIIDTNETLKEYFTTLAKKDIGLD